MGAWGRIHKTFYKHPKVLQCSIAAIGLWTLSNAWCRDHRKQGFIPTNTALELAGDTGEPIAELIHARLWFEVDGGYQFNDWLEWNADDNPHTLAEQLVYENIPTSQPEQVHRKLRDKTAELLAEGIEPLWIGRGLKEWVSRHDAGVHLLPFLISDLMRQNKGSELESVMRGCWSTGDLAPLYQRGHVFDAPEVPSDLTTIADIRAFMLAAKRQWINSLRDDLKAKAS